MGLVYALADAQAMTTTLYDPAFWSRFQFGFTLVYHYLFTQLTKGLAWFLVYWNGAPCERDAGSVCDNDHNQPSTSDNPSLTFLE
jgi:hypothetical protein